MATITKEALKEIQNEIVRLTESVLAQRGYRIKFNGGRYNPTSATLKLEVGVIGENGETPEAMVFKKYATSPGSKLNLSDLGRGFICGGKFYTLTGMRDCRSEYKFYGRRIEDGKTFLFNETVVHYGLTDFVNRPR